jgi:hypothetical protein
MGGGSKFDFRIDPPTLNYYMEHFLSTFLIDFDGGYFCRQLFNNTSSGVTPNALCGGYVYISISTGGVL